MTDYGLLKVLAKIAERDLLGAKYICQNPDGTWFASIEKPTFNEVWSADVQISDSEYLGTPTVYEIDTILYRLYAEPIESGACYMYSFKKKTVTTKGVYFPGETQGLL